MNSAMIQNRTVTVFGAYGHTGRFVVQELRKRGFTPILSGRDAAKLKEAGNAHPGSEVRVATVDDSGSLDPALSGAAAVINCAGPFIDTAAPVIDAAMRASIHYLDIAAEQASVRRTRAIAHPRFSLWRQSHEGEARCAGRWCVEEISMQSLRRLW